MAAGESTASFTLAEGLAADALEVAGIGVFLIDADAIIVAANAAVLTMLGRSEVELVGRTLDSVLLPIPSAGESERRVVRGDGGRIRVLMGSVGATKAYAGCRVITLRDITVRRQVEASLRDLDERMRLMIEAAQDAIITINENSRIVDWNSAAAHIFGWSREDAIGSVLTELIVPPQHRLAHHEGLVRYLAHGKTGILNRRIETTAMHRDGHEFDIELAIWPVRTADHYTFTSFIRDISDRKRAERALAQSETRYRAVVENANEGIIVTQDGFIRFANPRSYALTGRPQEVVAATPFIELIHPEDRARVYGNYLKRLRGEQVESQYTFRAVTASGEVRSLQISAVAIEWEGRPATLNFLSDVTEQIAMADKLTQSLAQRDAILETSAAGILFIQQGHIRWVNPALEKAMLGYASGDLIGKGGGTLFADHTAWRSFVDATVEALKEHRKYETERELRHQDGSLGWYQLSGRALNVDDLPAGTIWNVIDIAERKRAEEEVRRTLQRERELSELKSRFVSMTSHEFRTPLSAILSSVELLEDYGQTMSAGERGDLTKLIKGSLSRMTEMLEQVLFIGRADADRLEFRPELHDVAVFCAGVLQEVRASVAGMGAVQLTIASDICECRYDANLMRHVLVNLLSNAVKYCADRASIRLTVRVDQDRLIFEVADRGIGISAEDVPHLFETFYRAKNVGTIAGTGLGLSIVKQCVDLHGGSIAVDSKLGAGTTVTVTIPLLAA